MHALDLLSAAAEIPSVHLVTLVGDDSFLQRYALQTLRSHFLSAGDGEYSFSRWEGANAAARDVLDEIATVGLFGNGTRLASISEADSFISRHRQELEKFAQSSPGTGILVLEVKSLPSNTRLYKLAQKHGLLVECATPPANRLKSWMMSWAKEAHGISLERAAADLLLELVGPAMGLLDQEIAKLALLATPKKTVSDKLVQEVVGGWRSKTVWQLLDAALDGNTNEAIEQVDRLILGGESPIGILAQIASSLRRLSSATVLISESEAAGLRMPLRSALQQSGVKPFVLAKSESQLRRLGRDRGLMLSSWLLETDLALKGTSSTPTRSRLALEQLLVRLAVPTGKSSPRSVHGHDSRA